MLRTTRSAVTRRNLRPRPASAGGGPANKAGLTWRPCSRRTSRAAPPPGVNFYNQRGTAEQWIKEGKYAVRWTLTTLREKLVKISSKIVCRDRYVTLQLAEVAVSRGIPKLEFPRAR